MSYNVICDSCVARESIRSMMDAAEGDERVEDENLFQWKWRSGKLMQTASSREISH
jgi:hypothetical protein